MGPLIDAELEKLDRRHAHLTKLSSHLVEALDMYRALMREPPQQQQQQQQHQQPNMNMGVMMPGYPFGGMQQVPSASGPGAMKYPFPQPQAPPQSPSMPPYAPPGAGPAAGINMYASNQVPTNPPMPYGAVNMGPGPAFVNPYAGHPPNF